MSTKITTQVIARFFIVRIMVGIICVVSSVALTELTVHSVLRLTAMNETTKGIIVSVLDSTVALATYIFLFKYYEKRKIHELATSDFALNSVLGFGLGLLLQSLFIFILFLAGAYRVIDINPASSVLPGLAAAITAGFVAEILIRGIFFRIIEEKIGTVLALVLVSLVFVFMHGRKDQGNLLSTLTTAMEAGVLLSAAFVYSGSLWLPIFLHLAWDWVEPGFFGGINPSLTIPECWITSEITGPSILSGGAMGPQNSIQSLVLCTILRIIFLFLAKKKNKFRKPSWSSTA